MADIFWEICFNGKDGIKEEEHDSSLSLCLPPDNHNRRWTAKFLQENEITCTEIVRIHELRSGSILSNVGLQTWEAALLLCAFLIKNEVKIVNDDIIEIGSGAGLCSMLTLHLKQRALTTSLCLPDSKFEKNYPGEICLTDNDPVVLANLCHVLEVNPKVHSNAEGGSCNGVSVSVEHFDWNTASDNKYIQRFDSAIGSALCYATGHTESLLSVIRSLLLVSANAATDVDSNNRLNEVIIVELKDRIGFQELLDLLRDEVRLNTVVQSVDEEMYCLAQKIRCTHPAPLFQSVMDKEDDHILCERWYHFPTMNCDVDSMKKLEQDLNKTFENVTLRTKAECFVVVTITRR